jgi:hypothetical protein
LALELPVHLLAKRVPSLLVEELGEPRVGDSAPHVAPL